MIFASNAVSKRRSDFMLISGTGGVSQEERIRYRFVSAPGRPAVQSSETVSQINR